MITSHEFISFLNEKAFEYLPAQKIKVGNKYNFRCPFCGDSHKSLTKKRGWWYLDTASYYCWNCGQALSGIKFLEARSGESYQEIRKEYLRLFLKSGLNHDLSSHVEIPKTEPSIIEYKSIIKQSWKNELSENAKTYLANRKVLDAPFLKDTLYSCYGKNNDEYILIPWTLNGCEGAYYQVNDFMKNHSLKYIFPKDKKKLVFGLDNIDISWPYIIIVEGVYDSLFIKNCIATGTKSITESQYKLIHERYPHHQIVVSFDNDIPGISSMVKLIKAGKDFKYFRWFNSNTKQKDINEYVLAKNDVNIFTDPNKLEKMIINGMKMKLFLIENNLWNCKEYNHDKNNTSTGTQRKIPR